MSPPLLRSLDRSHGAHDEIVGVPGGPTLKVRVYNCGRCDEKPVVLHFHGGAFVGGGLDEGSAVANAFAAAGAAVASIDYPLAPEHPFPGAAEAGYAVLQWLDRQRRRLADRHAPLFVAGEEAGGNLATAVAMMARDRAGPALAGAVLLSPMLDSCVATASHRHAKAGPVGCPWADGWRAYLSKATDALHPYAAPAHSLRLAGLPPTLLITAADDPLRDETQAFARRLRTAQVPVQESLLPGPTGWPRSYRHTDAVPWSVALVERLRPFLHAVAPEAARHP